MIQRLGRWLAPLALMIPGRARNAVLTNLALCFPELDRRARGRLARETFAEAIATILELGPLWRWKRARVLALVRETVGLDKLDAALARGRGVVLLGPHLGAWEIAGLYLSARVPMTSMYRPPRVRALQEVCKRARERFGARLLPADHGGVRALYRSLRRGEIVAVLPDQDPGHGAGIFVPFFGIPANTSTLTARLLADTGAVPLLVWSERLPCGGGYRLHLVEPDAAVRSADLQRATRALNLEVERLVRSRPQQYLWTYRRFRHRPAGEPSLYKRGSEHAALATEARETRVDKLAG